MELHPFAFKLMVYQLEAGLASRNLCPCFKSVLFSARSENSLSEKKKGDKGYDKNGKRHPAIWRSSLHVRKTDYTSPLEVEQSIVIIYEWTPTFAIDHLPLEKPLSKDEREFTNGQEQQKKRHTPGSLLVPCFATGTWEFWEKRFMSVVRLKK